MLAHFKIDTIVVTLVLEETANLGLLQNNIQLIRKLLLPLLGEL